MDPESGEAPILAFDRYVLDIKARRLTLDGRAIALPARAFDLLAILALHRGEAVSRERLYELLWPQGFVEDGNLTQNVYLLRRLLDPSGNGRRFIETLPRHGYRFAAPIKELGPAARALRWSALRGPALRFALCACLAAVTLVLSGSTVVSCTAQLDSQAAISYALGVYHFNMRTPGQMRASIGYFQRTIHLAPDNPLGYAGLAGVYAIEAQDGDSASSGYQRLAQRYVNQALARDPDNAEAHAVRAYLDQEFRHDLAAADREYATVFAFKPDYAEAHHWHAVLQLARGHISAAVDEWELAHRLDPTSEVISRWLGLAYVYAHRPNDAISVLKETIDLEPADHEAWLNLASAQEQRGRFGQAIAALEHVRQSVPHKGPYVTVLEARVKALSRHGFADDSTVAQMRRLAASRRIDGQTLAYFFAALGKRDEAIALLRREHSRHDLDVSMERYDPRLDSLRSDPRFKSLFD